MITSKVTASAAEMLISALSPYMEVNVVGDITMAVSYTHLAVYKRQARTPFETDLKALSSLGIMPE